MLKHYSYMCIFVVGFFTIAIITKADGFWLVACLSLIGPYCVNWITIGRFGYRKSHTRLFQDVCMELNCVQLQPPLGIHVQLISLNRNPVNRNFRKCVGCEAPIQDNGSL